MYKLSFYFMHNKRIRKHLEIRYSIKDRRNQRYSISVIKYVHEKTHYGVELDLFMKRSFHRYFSIKI